MDTEKSVQGVGLYAEFSRENATTQVIIVPDGYNTAGGLVKSSIIRRTITTHTPKKQWKFTKLSNSEIVSPADEAEREQYVDDRMTYATTLFDQLLRGEWELIKQPVLIEVSKKDYDSIHLTKTPTKMIYRVSQSRIALDFPADLIKTTTASL
jgi:hypothetical protein